MPIRVCGTAVARFVSLNAWHILRAMQRKQTLAEASILIDSIQTIQTQLARRSRLQHVADFENAYLLHAVDIVMDAVAVIAASYHELRHHELRHVGSPWTGDGDVGVVGHVEDLLARVGTCIGLSAVGDSSV